LGGNSQDNTCWNPAAAPHPDWCKGQLGIGDFRLYSRAAKASGWRLILGINLKQNSSPWALDEITHGVTKGIEPEQIIGLELGNEPDLFSRDGSRPETYSPADQVKDFLAYGNAFQRDSIAKQYALIGPATCCKWRNAHDLGTFMDGAGASKLSLVTVHSYLLTTCGGRKVSIAELLAPELMTRFNQEAQGLVAGAHERKLPIALAETNSASCGGMPGVSNAFAAALWGIDSLFSAAEDGYSGVNFHFSYRPGGSSYNPVDTYKRVGDSNRVLYQNVVEPLYYGMYLFAHSASGEYLLPVSTKTASNVRSYATSTCPNCQVHTVVINKDVSAAGRVRVHVSNRTGAAKLLLLKAPKLDSRSSEVTYGGMQFDGEGRLPTPRMEQIESDSNGDYEFNLPNAAAALLIVPSRKQP
jgi:glycosyl hydrolase family 79